jgi:serine/threonine protein phosphatase 1
MPPLIKRFTCNTRGRDLVVGDIHGCFSRLLVALLAVGFDPKRDRLFSVGDLVDRGPESDQVVSLLRQRWFHAVRGNHDQMVIEVVHETCDPALHLENGGAWLYGRSLAEMQDVAAALESLPLAMEVETAAGKVGIVHADIPLGWSWAKLCDAIGCPEITGLHDMRQIQAYLQWGRTRYDDNDDTGVPGIRAVVVGHTVVPAIKVLGNVIHIDTGAYKLTGSFTILDLATLEPARAPVNEAAAAWVGPKGESA